MSLKFPKAFNLFAALVAIAVGLAVIAKVFFMEGCFAFDANDDANHTFTGLFVAQNMLRHFVLPQINYFNNFGSPILGDALTYPFSIHSITYYFLPNYLAMTVNRAVFAALIIWLGYKYFSIRFERFISLICSLGVFFAMVSIWFYTAYHMQLTLFFIFAAVICLERIQMNARFYSALLFVTLSAMMLSLTINVSIFVLAYVGLYQWITGKFRFDRKLAAVAVLIFSSLLVAAPQLIAFFEGMANSVRGAGHYDERGAFEAADLFYEVISYTNRMRWHPDATVLLTFPVCAFVLFGLSVFDRKKAAFWIALLLGLAPVVAAYFLMVSPEIWWSIPLVKSVDLTRVIWISLPFLFLSVGEGLTYLKSNLQKKGVLILAGVVLALAVLAYATSLDWSRIRIIDVWAWEVFIGSLVVAAVLPKFIGRSGFYGAALILTAGPLFYGLVTTGITDLSLCRSSHHYSDIVDSTYRPQGLIAKMERNTRMANAENTALGNDFRGVYYGILGSNQRAIASQKSLLEYLDGKHLITIETDPNRPYSFSAPWDGSALAKLGIRYVTTEQSSAIKPGAEWTSIELSGGKELFENKQRPTPIYLDDASFLKTFEIVDNRILIELPELKESTKLTATFLNQKGMQAKVDGKDREFLSTNDPFIHLELAPGDHHVELEYSRFSWLWIFGFLIAGFVGLYCAQLLLSFQISTKHELE